LYSRKGLFKKFSFQDYQDLDFWLEAVGLKSKKLQRIGSLSGGEFQRLMLARALTAKPEILILDEPEAGVDELGKAQFYRLLQKLKTEDNISILLISHDIGMVFEKCDRIMCINKTLHCHKSVSELKIADIQEVFSTDFDIWIKGKEHYRLEHEK